MTILNAAQAQASLDRLIDETALTHRPVFIHGQRSNAVLLSEDDWNAINETLYLTSIPGMRESILEGMAAPAAELEGELDW